MAFRRTACLSTALGAPVKTAVCRAGVDELDRSICHSPAVIAEYSDPALKPIQAALPTLEQIAASLLALEPGLEGFHGACLVLVELNPALP